MLLQIELLARFFRRKCTRAYAVDDFFRTHDKRFIRSRYALIKPDIVFKAHAHIAAHDRRHGGGGHLVATRAQHRPHIVIAEQAVSGLFALAIAQMQGPAPSEVDMSVIESLTPREREIFALLPGGLSNIELGRTLGISPGTAKIHVERILNKLGVKDRTQAAVKAVELGYKASH